MSQVNLTFRVPPEWRDELEKLSTRTGRSVSQLGQDAISAYLKKAQPDTQACAIADLQLRLSHLEERHRALASLVAGQIGEVA